MPRCPTCTATIAAGLMVCPQCGVALKRRGGPRKRRPPPKVSLWNPLALVAWSAVLTPAWGAFMMARNWRALGKPADAKAALVWVVGFPAIVLLTGFLPLLSDHPAVATYGVRLAYVAGFAAWIVTGALPQLRLVRTQLGERYQRAAWPVPLGLGALTAWGLGSLLLGGVHLAVTALQPQPTLTATQEHQIDALLAALASPPPGAQRPAGGQHPTGARHPAGGPPPPGMRRPAGTQRPPGGQPAAGTAPQAAGDGPAAATLEGIGLKLRNVSSALNRRTLMIGLEQYAIDHRGHYPPRVGWVKALSQKGYLPGNHLPKNPFVSSYSQVAGMVQARDVPLAAPLAPAGRPPTAPWTRLGTAHAAAGGRYDALTPGALVYDATPDRGAYVVYAIGLIAGQAVVLPDDPRAVSEGP